MTLVVEDIYSSPNGDRWRLIRDEATARSYVRHEANPASGGHVTDTDVEVFLEQGGAGPEHVVLRQFLAEREGTSDQG